MVGSSSVSVPNFFLYVIINELALGATHHAKAWRHRRRAVRGEGAGRDRRIPGVAAAILPPGQLAMPGERMHALSICDPQLRSHLWLA